MARIEKILVGSPTYKTVVGNVTRVNKVVVGVPLSTVTIGPYVDIDNIVGLDTTGKTEGGVITYDSDNQQFVVTDSPTLEVDGKTYPSDSDHTNILIRRSGTQGEPLILQQGELAYSYLPDPGTDGFGNGGDRLYIATGANDGNGNSTSIDVIGGKYFTDLLNHQQGVLTASSAILTDENRRIDTFLADSGTIDQFYSTEANLTEILTPLISTDDMTIAQLDGTPYYRVHAGGPENNLFYQTGLVVAKTELKNHNRFADLDPTILTASQDLRTVTLTDSSVLDVNGLTFLDSTRIRKNLYVAGNLFVDGNTTSIETENLLIEDKQIVIANGASAVLADGAGIAVGDSASPVAYINWDRASEDSACWRFSDPICTPSIEVDQLDFDVIDCGTYA